MTFTCSNCNKTFSFKHNLLKHIRNQHNGEISCQRCQRTFNRFDNCQLHDKSCLINKTRKRTSNQQEGGGGKKQKTNSALENTFVNYSVNLEDKEQNSYFKEDLTNGVYTLKEKNQQELTRKNAIKLFVSLHVNFHLSIDPSYVTEPAAVLNTEPVVVLLSTNLNETLDNVCDRLFNAIDDFLQ